MSNMLKAKMKVLSSGFNDFSNLLKSYTTKHCGMILLLCSSRYSHLWMTFTCFKDHMRPLQKETLLVNWSNGSTIFIYSHCSHQISWSPELKLLFKCVEFFHTVQNFYLLSEFSTISSVSVCLSCLFLF